MCFLLFILFEVISDYVAMISVLVLFNLNLSLFSEDGALIKVSADDCLASVPSQPGAAFLTYGHVVHRSLLCVHLPVLSCWMGRTQPREALPLCVSCVWTEDAPCLKSVVMVP